MMNDPLDHPLLEASWRRKLTEAEQAELQAWLASHPQAQADVEAETGLTELLGRLADPPVASNFTAQVLQAVEREKASQSAPLKSPRNAWRKWFPRSAFASIAVLAVGLTVFHHKESVRRAHLADSVAAISGVSSLPAPEILQDFEVIRALKTTPVPDEQLLTLLQ